MLPELGKHGYNTIEQSASYYIIDSEWNELNDNGSFIAPKSPMCLY